MTMPSLVFVATFFRKTAFSDNSKINSNININSNIFITVRTFSEQSLLQST